MRLIDVPIEIEIKRHAIEAYPEEAVGFVFEDRYERTANLADNPRSGFVISPIRFARACNEGLKYVVHSHPVNNGEVDGEDCTAPSEQDIRCMIDIGRPLGLVVCDGVTALDTILFGSSYIPPLEGREFRHGPSGTDNKGDCLALVRDYYRSVLGVNLPEFPRRWLWWEDSDVSMYDYHLPRTGFRQVWEPATNDVCVMKIQSSVNNHAGIVLDDDAILHHLVWRQSRKDGHSRWRSRISAYWRYEG